MLGVDRETAAEGVTALRKLPDPAGLILTSLRAESGDLLGKKQGEALFGGTYGRLNLYILGADNEEASVGDALTQFRELFAESRDARVLLFELTDIAVTIILGERESGLSEDSGEEKLVEVIQSGMDSRLGKKDPNGLVFALNFIGRGVSTDGQIPNPQEVKDLVAPFVRASARMIAASADAVDVVNESDGTVVETSGREGGVDGDPDSPDATSVGNASG